MGTFFEEGGFGMYPTLVFGFLLAGSAALTTFRSPRFWSLTAVLGAVTLASGVLGMAMGVINTFRYVAKMQDGDALRLAATGLAESTNNIVLALVIAIPSGLVAAWAAMRAARATPALAS